MSVRRLLNVKTIIYNFNIKKIIRQKRKGQKNPKEPGHDTESF